MSTSHETTAPTTLEVSHQARSLYDIQKVEEWRRAQIDVLTRLRGEASITDDSYVTKFNDEQDELLRTYLENQGIDESDPAYDEVRSLYTDASIINISSDVWGNRPSSRGVSSDDNRSGRDIFKERVEQLYDETAPSDSRENEESEETDVPESERLERLEQLAQAKHAAYADRQNGRWYDIAGRGKRQEAYEAARDEYAAALREDIRIRLDQTVGDAMGEEQKEETINELAAELEEADAQQDYDALMKRGGKIAEMRARYEKLSKWKQIGVLAVGGAIAAGSMGFLAGAAGAGLIASVGLVSGTRLGYGHFMAKSKLYRQPTAGEKFVYDRDSEVSAQDQIVNHLTTRSDKSIETGDDIKRKAVRTGLAAAAIGGTLGMVGAGVHVATQDGAGEAIKHWGWGQIGHEADVAAASNYSVGADGADSGTHTGMTEFDPSAELQQPTPVQVAEVVTDVADQAPDVAEQLQEAVDAQEAVLEIPEYTVSSGEGWFDTFNNLGVNDAHAAELLDELGPELKDLGVAYEMGDSWGIASAGELDPDAVNLIMETAHEHGWLDNAAEIEGNYPVVDHGEGLNEFVQDNYSDTLTHEESMELGAELHDQGFMYNDPEYLGERFGNPYGISGPDVIDAQTDMTIRDMVDNGELDNSVSVDTNTEVSTADTNLAETAQNNLDASVDLGVSDQASQMESTVELTNEMDVEPTENESELNLDTELSELQKQVIDARIAQMVEDGTFSQLNTIPAEAVSTADMRQFATAMSEFNFNDGTPIAEVQPDGRFEFNDRPTSAGIPNDAQAVINRYLEALGLNTYQSGELSGLASADINRSHYDLAA